MMPDAGITDSHNCQGPMQYVGRIDRAADIQTRPASRHSGSTCYSRLQPTRLPLSTKTKTTTDLWSESALVPVTTHGRAILHSPILIVHGITNASPHRSTRRRRTVIERETDSSSRPLIRILGCWTFGRRKASVMEALRMGCNTVCGLFLGCA